MKELKCTFEERESSKTGKKYKAIFIKLGDNYEKIVLLSAPEIALIEQNLSSSTLNNSNLNTDVFESFK